jgi:hypothetical protein
MGSRISLVVTARDGQTGQQVSSARVKVKNFDADGKPARIADFPQGAPHGTTFYQGHWARDGYSRKWIAEEREPSSTVSAPNYANVDVPFTFVSQLAPVS